MLQGNTSKAKIPASTLLRKNIVINFWFEIKSIPFYFDVLMNKPLYYFKITTYITPALYEKIGFMLDEMT